MIDWVKHIKGKCVDWWLSIGAELILEKHAIYVSFLRT